MEVYDRIIKDTLNTLKSYEIRELRVNPEVEWNCLKSGEFLMEREVAFELGDRFKPSAVFNCTTSNSSLIDGDRILLLGKDIKEIKENTNFSRVTIINVDKVEDPNQAYIGIKKLEYERYRVIPEGYMILSSSIENKENIRVSKKAVKRGLSFEIIGNLFINHYKKIKGVNNVWMIFIVGDYPCVEKLVELSHEVDEVTNAFDHILKNVIVDCEECPLQVICDKIEELRELHFKAKIRS